MIWRVPQSKQLQPCSIGGGWKFVKNDFLEAEGPEITRLMQAQSISNPLLEIEHTHHERNRKYSFQDYTVSILLEWSPQNNMQGEYKISLCVQPCNKPLHRLDSYQSENRKIITAKMELLAAQYVSPDGWSVEHIAWIQAIWEQERHALNRKGIIRYSGTKYPGPPPSYYPLRVPAGWKILMNSLMNENQWDYLDLENKQPGEPLNLYWERDISIFLLEQKDDCIYVELQDYSDACHQSCVLRIHVYREKSERPGVAYELGEFYSASIFEIIESLETYLLLYKNGIEEPWA